MNAVNIFKLVTPPILVKAYYKLFNKKNNQKSFPNEESGFFNNYETWRDALNDCSGYDKENILLKVKDSLLKVKSGKAIYERDSVLFDKKQYSESLLIGLLNIASKNNFKLNVLDFGGSLGSTYYQNHQLLRHLKHFTWNIVEQENFVRVGKRSFENDQLRFYKSIEDCLIDNEVQVIIFSSVLQYLEDPYSFINSILEYNIENIIIDRTSFIIGQKERICKQIVPERIYLATYPIHFFNEREFLNTFIGSYKVVEDFRSFCDKNYLFENNSEGYWKGYNLKRL